MRYNEFKLNESVVNDALKKVQQYLMSKGYDLGPTKDDGLWGPYTKAAIDAYKAGTPPAQVKTPISTPAPAANNQAPSTNNQTPAANNQTPGTQLPNGDLMPTKGRISGHYGRTVPGPQGKPVKHPGVDIAAPEGTPIIAPADGKVIFAGWANTAGNMVEILSKDGHKHRFMHMSKIMAKAGSQVKAGETLGLVGNTGFSRGNHLHWEKYAGTNQLNPLAE
jgi:murein DD-endopeptidase MepM/ murein hydrolase activator NlpD